MFISAGVTAEVPGVQHFCYIRELTVHALFKKKMDNGTLLCYWLERNDQSCQQQQLVAVSSLRPRSQLGS
jgi:hypothetical protein